MAKKYSIQMEDDQVVSVEVDGVSYKTPDDIPNDRDREQILKMIARSDDTELDDGFDHSLEREFQQDLAEMKQQSFVFPKLLIAIFAGIALITLVIAVVSTVSNLRLLSREQSTPGLVVEVVERTSRDSETGDVSRYSYPVVQYALPGRDPLKVQLAEGSWPPEYYAGDEVVVLYDPLHPRDARIHSASSNLLLWILPGVTFIVGAGFAGAAWMVFKFFPPRKNETGSR